MTKLRRFATLATLLYFTFVAAAEAQTVRGTVRVSAGGAPAQYALVVFSQGGHEMARVITDQNGFYFVRSLSPGHYLVHIHRQNNDETRSVDVLPAGGTFEFTVK
jgi:Carboxypeptidase regulatory-like domain